jgi:hypothetical protein
LAEVLGWMENLDDEIIMAAGEAWVSCERSSGVLGKFRSVWKDFRIIIGRLGKIQV